MIGWEQYYKGHEIYEIQKTVSLPSQIISSSQIEERAFIVT